MFGGKMSKKVLVFVFIALALLALPLGQTASAGAPKQQGAAAFFNQWDESGCVETYIMLDFFNQEWKAPDPYKITHTAILAGQRDHCQGVQLLSGFILGISPGTSFKIDPSLKKASVTVDSQIYDLMSNRMVEIKAELQWTGYGSRRQEVRNEKYHNGTCIYFNKTKEATRSATVSGWVILDGQPVQDISWARISEFSEKSNVVNCP
jgi:hypothetical protein